ncbi:MAG: hypothetical protein ND807_10550 [Vicinamibacterales bacterium]|nr:hypothetical protein [Vicinamibacterales bacterium]
MRTVRIATAIAAVVFVTPLTLLQAQSSTAQSCEHHQAMTAALATIETLVADTKTSKDVAALHAALDQIGSQVTKMQESDKKCSGMMEKMMPMMEKMKSMPQKDAGEHQH